MTDSSSEALSAEVSNQHRLRELNTIWFAVRDAINSVEQKTYKPDDVMELTFTKHAESLREDILVAVRRVMMDQAYERL